ncbi:hypothetical protein [Streptomyces monomycini]|uniref:MmyB family transcriptional regulator n=1 Tax=Streptomyces monomycini TaxID=371720 RepID=UPI0012FF17B4
MYIQHDLPPAPAGAPGGPCATVDPADQDSQTHAGNTHARDTARHGQQPSCPRRRDGRAVTAAKPERAKTPRSLFADWEDQARAAVESLRSEGGRGADDQATNDHVAELRGKSTDFDHWWESTGSTAPTWAFPRVGLKKRCDTASLRVS